VSQPELFDPMHGITTASWPARLKHYSTSSIAERVYLRTWHAQNTRNQAVNGGVTTLESILDPWEPTQRDAIVASSMAQWLGCNAGRGFVMTAERQIEREADIIGELGSYRVADRVSASHMEQARVIASVVPDEHLRKRLADTIARALAANGGAAGLTIGPRPPVERGIILRPEEP
jgi:hypothetical protein